MKSVTVQRYDEAHFDSPAQAAARRSQTYVVCSTQRSGSGLLCRGLGETGVAGTPTEYFNSELRAILSERWGCGPGLDAYAEAVRTRRTSRTGVLGTKLHWYQLEQVRAEAGAREGDEAALLEELLGERPTCLHISRRDVDRQAVSLWVAHKTGVWARPAGSDRAEAEAGAVPYDFEGILERRRENLREESCWQRFFSSDGIAPIEVVYEVLAASFRSTLAAVLDQLVPGHSAQIPSPLTVPLADAQSEELLLEFTAKRR